MLNHKSENISKEVVSDYMDDSDDEIHIEKLKRNSIIPPRLITDYLFADTRKYNFMTWKECFPNNKVKLKSLLNNSSWNEFFDIIEKKSYFPMMEKILSRYLSEGKKIVPHAELVFNIFNSISLENIKVVIIGQDPYPGISKFENKMIPQAMGYSFSVPLNYPVPRSLDNIYANLIKFKHINKVPKGGCLATWILQGVFLLNSSLTNFLGNKTHPHKEIWNKFTHDLIQYIDRKCENVVFMVWGKAAHLLCLKVNPKKHCIITSSHPSPYSCDKGFSGFTYSKKPEVTNYPSFNSTNHFGKMNEYLKSVNKSEIFLDLIDVNIKKIE
jgi:uracil-DNA glycosylase